MDYHVAVDWSMSMNAQSWDMVVVTSSPVLGGTKVTLYGYEDGHYMLQQKVQCLQSRHLEVVESFLDA